MSAFQDGAESVDAFLARIAGLSNQNAAEEAERAKKMEADMLQARKERQARRAERARSISPSKTGPAAAATPARPSTPGISRAIEPPVILTPSSQDRSSTHLESRKWQDTPTQKAVRNLPDPPQTDSNIPIERSSTPTLPQPSATTLTRSGTLSWQQRPSSRTTSPVRSRPSSAAPASSPIVAETRNDEPDVSLSRSQMAQSLSAKDPTWFRQTQDRGQKSAAYRKGETDGETGKTPSSRGMQLPGMTRAASPRIGGSSSSPITSLESMDRQRSPAADNDPFRNRESPRTTLAKSEKSTTTLNLSKSQTLPPPSQSHDHDHDPVERVASTSPTRSGSMLSAVRPPSPTKGLGGFVQSAMMKRSDSVNKRWSVQASAGLKRGDSVAGGRTPITSPASGTASLHSRTMSRDSWMGREPERPKTPVSRPDSMHAAEGLDVELPSSQPSIVQSKSSPRGAGSPQQLTKISPRQDKANAEREDGGLSRSPSKTLDPRRWSPTKSSWLESALAKPEPIKPSLLSDDTPAWMVDLKKSKIEAASKPIQPENTEDVHHPKNDEHRPQVQDRTTLEKPSKKPVLAKISSESADAAGLPSAGIIRSGREASPLVEQSQSKEIPPKPEKPKNIALSPSSKDTGHENSTLPSVKSPEEVTSVVKPPVLKPKSQEPPKPDFRSALKSRSIDTTTTQGTEPEFRSMFGKLKKVQTHNYVAPDELKDNINRGKAGLSKTDGPQQSKPVDEFKENLVQQRETIKTSVTNAHRRNPSRSPERPPDPEPEALARRKTLLRPLELKPPIESRKPEPPVAKPANLVGPLAKSDGHAESGLSLKSSQIAPLPADPPAMDKKTQAVSEPPQTRASTTPATLPKPPTTARSNTNTVPSKIPEDHNTPATLAKSDLPLNSKLAARLNPALANILTRGPAPHPSSEKSSADASNLEPTTTTNSRSTTQNDDDGSGTLTHMTKARAKGPKRRAPKAETAEAVVRVVPHKTRSAPAALSDTKSTEDSTSDTKFLPQRVDSPKPMFSVVSSFKSGARSSQPPPKTQISQSSAGSVSQDARNRETADSNGTPKTKPVVAGKSLELRKVSNPVPAESDTEQTQSVKTMASKSIKIASEPKSVSAAPEHESSDGTAIGSNVSKSFEKQPLTPSKSKLNVGAAPRSVDSATKPSVSTKPTGPGLSATANKMSTPVKSPTASKALETPQRQVKQSSLESNVKMFGSNKPATSGFLSTFFQSPPRGNEKTDHDTESFLEAQKGQLEKSTTIKKQIWEVTGDGKMLSMPQQQEHILFEDSMYLCVHQFENSNKSKSAEAYLWCGDAVSDADADDAQLFCRKSARENNAKLVVLKQGREPPLFFQALGGIVIIRRSKSSVLYMLRGRRHFSHVAFDEVDFSPSSLCSGFSYLISAKFGKLFLWKGKGSGVDEIGCARLIGMDIGLTGEIEELDEGKESSSFWESFPTGSETGQTATTPSLLSGEWKARANHKGYPCKLFRVGYAAPKAALGFWGLRPPSPPKPVSNKAQIEEISPFCQKDLEATGIYILDAYREIYVYVGHAATNKSAEFVTAVQVAEEMAVLVPSIQDRSLLPMCYAVFGDPPLFFQMSFRKWDPSRSASTAKTSICMPIQEVMSELGMR